MNWFFNAPRRALLLVFLACAAMLAFGLYLQHVVGLEPCPMCIVQRYALMGVGLFSLVGAAFAAPVPRKAFVFLALASGVFGAYTAARQSWLQWYPPETVSCGRDFYGMIEAFPLKRALPMIFRGGGDCSQIDWTFLKLSIANWSFIAFVVLSLLLAVLLFKRHRRVQGWLQSGRVSKAA